MGKEKETKAGESEIIKIDKIKQKAGKRSREK